jgi:signal transduction histidine kinase
VRGERKNRNMIKPKIPQDEVKRVVALKEYSILDTLPEKEYDEITYLASKICKTPISLVSLIDDKRQWFKSHRGLDVTEIPKDVSFCAHAINDKNDILIVPDSRKDERFHDNPFVVDKPHFIFYAGVPLVNSKGYPLGTLCVIGNNPTDLDEFQINALKALSNQLIKLFELGKKSHELEAKIFEIETQNKGLEKFAMMAAHDIKSPLSNIVMLTELFSDKYSGLLDAEGRETLQLIGNSSKKLTQLIEGMLKYSKHSGLLLQDKEEICINKIIHDLIPLIDSKQEVKFHITPEKDILLYTNKAALEQILMNLMVNGIKYNDKSEIIISITIEDEKDFVKIAVIDNGPGIKEEDRDRIFQIFETTSNINRFGEQGTGIGLATVKSLVKALGGTIRLFSEVGKGSHFEFTVRK